MKTVSFEIPDHCVFNYGDTIEYRCRLTNFVHWGTFLGYVLMDGEDVYVLIDGGIYEDDDRVDIRTVIGKRVRVPP